MPRKLGQHFLNDKRIAQRIVDYAKISKNDKVLEIGPGKGVLTNILTDKAKEVIAIEKDKLLGQELLQKDNLSVIIGDALEIDFPKFNKIVANLPYQISSPITFKLFQYKWDLAVLMYQKEFADRFFAKPGDKNYSRLTLAINYYCIPEKLEIVSKGKFNPPPKIDSMIVLLKPIKPPFKTDKIFWDYLTKIFQHKKKIVRAALKSSKIPKEKIEKLPEALLKKRVNRCNINEIKSIIDMIR